MKLREVSSYARIRLREPGEVDLFDQISEGLGLEPGTTEPFFDLHDEYLIEGLYSQTIQLFTFWLSFHMAVLLSDQGLIPLILPVPATGHNYGWAGWCHQCLQERKGEVMSSENVEAKLVRNKGPAFPSLWAGCQYVKGSRKSDVLAPAH